MAYKLGRKEAARVKARVMQKGPKKARRTARPSWATFMPNAANRAKFCLPETPSLPASELEAKPLTEKHANESSKLAGR